MAQILVANKSMDIKLNLSEKVMDLQCLQYGFESKMGQSIIKMIKRYEFQSLGQN